MSVGIRAQVNLSPGREFGAVLSGNPQYRRGTFMLDLSGLDLKVGDLVRLCLVAHDTGGHETIGGEERFILFPRAASTATRMCGMTELRRAQTWRSCSALTWIRRANRSSRRCGRRVMHSR